MRLRIISSCLIFICQFSLAQQNNANTFYQKAQSAADKQQAFHFFKQAINQSRKDEDWAVYLKSLNKIMEIVPALDNDQTRQVFSWMKESLTLTKPNFKPLERADLHFNCALFYKHKSVEKDSALYHFNKARLLRSGTLGEWHESVAACYNSAADIYKYHKYQFADAEAGYEKALEIFERIGTTDLNVLAEVYYCLAATNRSQQDFQKAISYGTKTIELANKLNNVQLLERTYTIVANIYRDMGQSSTAKKYYDQAITLNLRSKSSTENLAWHYLSLAETLKNDSLYAEAIVIFSKARSIYDRIEEESKDLYIHCLNQLAETFLLKGDYKNSIATYTRVVNTLQAMGIFEGRQMAETLTGFGDYYRRTHDYDSSLFYYQKALKSAVPLFNESSDENPSLESIGNNFYIYNILNKKASLLSGLWDARKDPSSIHKSLQCLLLSEELLIRNRRTMDMEDAKWKFLDENYDVYEGIIASVYKIYQLNRQDSMLHMAFHYFEKSKSSSLAEALSQAERNANINASDSLFTRQNDLKRAIFKVQDELAIVLARPVPEHDRVSKLRNEIVSLDRKIQLNRSAIENKYPGYFKVKYFSSTPSLKDISKLLQSKNQIMIEYFFGSESVYGLCLSKGRVLFKKLGSSDSITTIIHSYREHFNERGSSFDKDVFTSFVSNSHQLYRFLIVPFKPLDEETKRIVFLPDGPLGQIPFETLIESKPVSLNVNYRDLDYLVNRNTIGYAYASVTLFDHRDEIATTPSVLAMAFSGDSPLGNTDFKVITGTVDELKMLEDKLITGQFLQDAAASEFNFKILSPLYDIIHLAVHGQGDLLKNNASSLHFSPVSDSLEDSELHAYELYGLKLKARLVVLSACETGLGKTYKGEGMMSMASAFAFSGCQNILMSLWKINDNISINLVDNFYDELLKGVPIDEAIAQAKRKYLNQADELSADPRVWAALVSYGNLEPVFEENKNRTSLIIFSIVVVLLLFYGVAYYIKKHSSRPSGRRHVPIGKR